MKKRAINKKKLLSFSIALTMCLTVISFTSVADEPNKDWPNCKMHYPQLPDPNGWDVFAMMPDNILADDFQCIESGPITDLHFWGSWYADDIPSEPIYGAPLGFHISIHADIPDPDEEGPLYSMPGELLWEQDVMYPAFECTPQEPGEQGWFEPPDYYEDPNHLQYFRYDILFADPLFYQEEGTIYWVDIAPYTDGMTWWGWKTSLDHWNDDAVYTEGSETVLSENFDGYVPYSNPFPPIGWTVYNVDGGDAWSLYPGASYAHTGAYCSRCYYDAPNDDWIVSAGIVMPASPVDFSVWIKGSTYTMESFEIWYATTGNSIADLTAGTLLYSGNAGNAWTQYSYPISESAGTTVWFAIHYTGNYQNFLFCDDWIFPDGSTEGFEGTPMSGWPPAGWTMQVVSGTDTDNYWRINITTTHPSGVIPTSLPYMAEYNIYLISAGNSARLYTPPLDFSGTGNSLSFMMYHSSAYPSEADNVVIQVSTDGLTWTDIATYLTYDPTTGWTNHLVDLSAYDGQSTIYVGFLGVSYYGYTNIYIDDVLITSNADLSIISSIYPLNNSINVTRPVSLFNVTVNGIGDDTISLYLKWLNHTPYIEEWENLTNWVNISDGTYSFYPTISNEWIWGNTTYRWSVNVTDGINWTNETYWFRTSGSRYDVNNNDVVNFQDAGLVWIHRTTIVPYDGLYDVNNNGQVNFQDAGLTWVNRD